MSHWHLKSINWLEQMQTEFLERLASGATIKALEQGVTVFTPNPHPEVVYLLESGICRIFRYTPDGSEFTLGLVVKGEVFGELAVVNDEPRDSFAVAQARCVVWAFPRELFEKLLHGFPEFAVVVTKQVSGKLLRFENRAEDLIFRSAASRLARTLIALGGEFGVDTDRGRTIGVRFTQAELSSMIGASRPTASLTLNGLRSAGLIDYSDGVVTLLSPTGLHRIADDPDARIPR